MRNKQERARALQASSVATRAPRADCDDAGAGNDGQAVGGALNLRRRAAAHAALVEIAPGELDAAIAALSTHSLRVGLTQDLFAAGICAMRTSFRR
jgi:hypothetical protein